MSIESFMHDNEQPVYFEKTYIVEFVYLEKTSWLIVININLIWEITKNLLISTGNGIKSID